MIRRSAWTAAVALAGSGLVSACTLPLPPSLDLLSTPDAHRAIPQRKVFLKNRTAQSFACAVEARVSLISHAFTLAPGDEYYRTADAPTVTMRCGGVRYTLAAGSRYAIQPVGAGFAIQEIVP